MPDIHELDFADFLAKTRTIPRELRSRLAASGQQGRSVPLQKLWQSSGLPAAEFAEAVAEFFALPRRTLEELLGATPVVDQFSRRFLRELNVFPFQVAGQGLWLAVGDPSDSAGIRAAQLVLNQPIELCVASFEDIEAALAKRLGEVHAEAPVAEVEEGIETDIDILRDMASGAPVVRAVNDLIEKAVELRASDIHVEPTRGGLSVRLRVDGLLRVIQSPSNAPPQAVVSRIKILAGLNIAERRLPQDGAARVIVGGTELDIRVATMPTQHGESAVIRLLPRDRGLLNIVRLGLSEQDEATLQRLLALPHGMLVVTGPTGSGKTTTLATAISILNQPSRKILTIEDPVEYEMPGVNQSQVKPSIGLTFANALRSFVRQDPDVIMVGEIRDSETANIAIHAALTGHLVLTTLHTETAAGAVPRLLDLGVESFLLQSTLRAVVAQRLVRILCDRCRVEHRLTASEVASDPRYAALGLKAGEVIYEPHGCESCGGTGYRGRCGVFEILEVGAEVRQVIGPKTDSSAIERAAVGAGMVTMIDHAVGKCRLGVTSVTEALRVTSIR